MTNPWDGDLATPPIKVNGACAGALLGSTRLPWTAYQRAEEASE